MSRFILALVIIPFLLGVSDMAYSDAAPGIGQCVRECAWENHNQFPTRKELFKECKRLCREGEPVITFEKTFGGADYDSANAIEGISEGGFIITGETRSFGAGDADVALMKTDAHGNVLWARAFGGSGHDRGYSVQETSEGGFIVVGETSSFGAGGYDIFLLRTDAHGNMLWERTFGGQGWEQGYSVQETSDGGFIITGAAGPPPSPWNAEDVCLLKTDSHGNAMWYRTFGGTNHDAGSSVQEASDGGFIIAGYTESFGAGDSDVYLVKTDSDGNEMWSRTFGGSGTESARAVQKTSDGGFIITGYTTSFGAGQADIYLVKTDADGKEVWSSAIGGTKTDEGSAVQETCEGGFIITGNTFSLDVGVDAYLVKTDADGNEMWSKTFGGRGYNYGHSVQETTDCGFIIAGSTNAFVLTGGSYDCYLIKTDAVGNVYQ